MGVDDPQTRANGAEAIVEKSTVSDGSTRNLNVSAKKDDTLIPGGVRSASALAENNDRSTSSLTGSVDSLEEAKAEDKSERTSAHKRLQQNPLIKQLKESDDDPSHLASALQELKNFKSRAESSAQSPRKAATITRKNTAGLTITRNTTRKKTATTFGTSQGHMVFGDILERIATSYTTPEAAPAEGGRGLVQSQSTNFAPPARTLSPPSLSLSAPHSITLSVPGMSQQGSQILDLNKSHGSQMLPSPPEQTILSIPVPPTAKDTKIHVNDNRRPSAVHDFRTAIRKFDFLEELKSLRIHQIELDEEEGVDLDRMLDEYQDEEAKEAHDEDDEGEWDDTPPPDIVSFAEQPRKESGQIQPYKPERAEKMMRMKTMANNWKTNGSESFRTQFRGEDIPSSNFPERSTFMAITLGAKGNNWHQKKSLEPKARDSIIAVPTGPREFIDPAVVFAEKQMEAWEKMKKAMFHRTGSKQSKKFKSVNSVLQVIIGLKKLGMNANLLGRVDKSTLMVVVQIKLWKKRAVDARITRREPTRKLLHAFEQDLATEVPFAIYESIIEEAIEILGMCKKKYASDLGENSIKTKGVTKHIRNLQKLIPNKPVVKEMNIMESLGSIFFNVNGGGGGGGRRGSEMKGKVFPTPGDLEDGKGGHPFANTAVDLSQISKSVILATNTSTSVQPLAPIRGSISGRLIPENSIANEVLIEIDESNENPT